MTSRLLTEGGILTGHKPLDDFISLFLVQSTIIIAICRGLSIMAMKLRQPAVIFEIIGGILMGPSAIGRDHYWITKIFSSTSRSYLQLVANVGLIFYLFIVGMELDPKLLVSHGRKAVGIAVVGMAVPFGLGVAISRKLFDTLQPEIDESKFTSFYVFIGTAMSITAFPVLARILKEEGLIYTKPGALVMGAAAINDALAWCLLILAIALASAGDISNGGYAFLCVLGFAIVLFGAFAPFFHRIVEEVERWKSPRWSKHLFAATICLLFVCAWTTALLGVHPIFGGFMFGLAIPKGSKLYHECNERIEELIVTFMLPLYFALSGLNTDVTQIHTNKQGAMVILVCFIATIGKFIGCGSVALLSGMDVRESAVVMVLMNTRGLVELIVLNLGLTYGLLNTETFSVMVLMCLFTTFLTCPLVNFIFPKSMRAAAKDKEVEHCDVVSEISAGEYTKEELEKENAEFSAPKHLKLSVVVDRLDQQQMLMRVLSLVTPVFVDSRLFVAAMKFHEPSSTVDDEYIGLSEGRLIKVQQEVTTLQQLEALKSSVSAAQAHQQAQLLPMALFCNTLGVNINAFQVRGDPSEFPSELRAMSKQYDSDTILMPWRLSDYMSMLFWKTLLRVSAPVALVVSKHMNELDPATGGQQLHDSNNNSTSLHVATAGDVENQAPHSGGSRNNSSHMRLRNNSLDGNTAIEMTSMSTNANTGAGGLPPTTSSRGRSASITENLAKMMNIEAFGYDNSSQGAGQTMSIIKDVVCLISGQATDRALLTLLARVAERTGVHVLVLITADRSDFAEPIARALAFFQSLFTRADNVAFVNLSSFRDDQTALASEVSSFKGEMFFMSYLSPPSNSVGHIHNSSRGDHSDNNSSHDAADRTAMLVNAGMPPALANCGLQSPELGIVGTKLREMDTFETVIIAHEPNVSKLRRQTMSAYTSAAGGTEDR